MRPQYSLPRGGRSLTQDRSKSWSLQIQSKMSEGIGSGSGPMDRIAQDVFDIGAKRLNTALGMGQAP